MSWASDVKRALQEGLHTDNLDQIAQICRRVAVHPSDNVPAFVIEQICHNLCSYWDAAPDVERHQAAEQKLQSPLLETVDAVMRGATAEEIGATLSRAISAYHVVISGV